MKKIVSIFVIASFVLLLFGCNINKKIENKIENTFEKSITEGINKITDGNIEFSFEDDKISYKTEEGEMIIGDNEISFNGDGQEEEFKISSENKWPEGKVAELVPKLNKGVITYSAVMSNICMINIYELENDEYENYVAKIKDAGFTEDSFELRSGTDVTYAARSVKGDYMALNYQSVDQYLSIYYELGDIDY